MGNRTVERLLCVGVGVVLTLAGVWIAQPTEDPEPTDEACVAALQRRVLAQLENGLGDPHLAVMASRHGTTRPSNRSEMVGRYRDDETGNIRIELRDDGRYVYEGIPGGTLLGWDPGVQRRTTYRDGRWRTVRAPRETDKPRHAQRHSGRWTFDDGALTLSPYDWTRGAEFDVSWDAEEAAIRVRFPGMTPGDLDALLLRHIAERE